MLMQMQKISKSFQYLDGRAVKWPLTYAKLLSRDQQFFAKVVKQIFEVNRKITFLVKKPLETCYPRFAEDVEDLLFLFF